MSVCVSVCADTHGNAVLLLTDQTVIVVHKANGRENTLRSAGYSSVRHFLRQRASSWLS